MHKNFSPVLTLIFFFIFINSTVIQWIYLSNHISDLLLCNGFCKVLMIACNFQSNYWYPFAVIYIKYLIKSKLFILGVTVVYIFIHIFCNNSTNTLKHLFSAMYALHIIYIPQFPKYTGRIHMIHVD